MDFVTNNLPLVILFVTSGAMLVWQFSQGSAKGVGPNEATLLINREDALVLDVREPSEFVTAHISGAKNIPLAKLAERVSELESHKDRTIVICCAAGSRSTSACNLLAKQGFTKVVSLSGGINAWASAGMPTKKGQK